MSHMSAQALTTARPLVGKKMMQKLVRSANESASAEISDFARRQMEKMGWSAGKGLGKNEQGIKSHLKIKRREELQGVGADKYEITEQQSQWWYNVYDRVASKIVVDASSNEEEDEQEKKVKRKLKKDKRKRKRKEGDVETIPSPTDEDLFAATGGKLFGRRAYGSCNGKLKRDEIQLKKAKRNNLVSILPSSDTRNEEKKDGGSVRKKARKSKEKKARGEACK
ncbi:hypothetical protein PsorP6_002859 [Peronosclerospora sorghi]|uniref:Uncharacterized protein n=1 Tax=Peronosclerospora sorghi TaxID=230839 RepID=A0ACC0VIA6_9STRA|nr:hypothetical protein PsorP6_002859 [Peronosclerospora sorghi]